MPDPTPRPSSFPPMLVVGFAAAVTVWIAWFITHLPWMAQVFPEHVSVLILLALWLIALTLGVSSVTFSLRRNPILLGLGAGLISAVPGLCLLGTQLSEPPDATGHSTGVIPSAGLITVGFIALAAVLGLIAGAIATLARGSNPPPPNREPAGTQAWLARFALVTCCAIVPLLIVGGLVTSTNSGLAVPDWPNTFGTNMFLYPLGPRSVPGRFLEHSHRLFGTLVGFTSLVLLIFTLRVEHRRWVKNFAIVAFLLVCLQGLLGGKRVTDQSRFLAMLHGVLAQLVFGVFVALSVYLRPLYITHAAPPPALPRKARTFSTALLHSMVVQLLLGAAYRHFRQAHILYTHAAFAILIVIAALLAGFILIAAAREVPRPLARTIKALGIGLVAVVIIQFALGWTAFFVGGSNIQADSIPQALIRTAHQANGALLLAFATAAFLWSRRLTLRARQSEQSRT